MLSLPALNSFQGLSIYPTGSAGVPPVPRRSRHAELVSASTPLGAQASRLSPGVAVMPNSFRHLPQPHLSCRSRLSIYPGSTGATGSAGTTMSTAIPPVPIGRRGFQPRNKPRRGVCPPPSVAQAPPGAQASRLRRSRHAEFISASSQPHLSCRSRLSIPPQPLNRHAELASAAINRFKLTQSPVK
jgi:hypothetical protein